MGAGKSTVGQLTADLLNMPFVDLDERIVQREKRAITAIFATDGEEYFRNCETDLLGELKEQPAAVYATGGGIVVREVNREAMASMGKVVYPKPRKIWVQDSVGKLVLSIKQTKLLYEKM